MSHFPPIAPEQLTAFNAILAQGPEILESHECPYPPEVKNFLKKLFGDNQAPVRETEFSVEELGVEVAQMYENIRHAADDTKLVDPKDKVAVLRMQSSLLEKMVEMKTTIRNLKWLSQFQKAVVDWIDENLEPAQRSDFIDQLGSLIRED